MSFYLKLTDQEATQMIESGMTQLFGSTNTEKFDFYTDCVVHVSTGDKYWRVQDLQYPNPLEPSESIGYGCEDFVINSFPEKTRYSEEYVRGIREENNTI